MESNKTMNTKRLLAVVIAVILFVLSSVTSIGRFQKKEEVKREGVSKILDLVGNQSHEERVLSGSNPKDRILVINIDGAISKSSGVYSGYDHYGILNTLNSVEDDPSIKGIILKVDSPGGGVYESAELRDKILQVKEATKIPFYTSMGSMAASGGYYVAAPTDKIFAAEETMTGSIGVIMQSLNFSKLLNRFGIENTTIKSSEFKDIGSAYREMTPRDRKIFQDMIDSSYDRFVKVVSDGRQMDESRVREIADGRIYDGSQALKLGLVDEIGYFEDVVNNMAKDLDLVDPQVFEISPYQINYLKNFLNIRTNTSPLMSELEAVEKLLSNYGDENAPRLMYLYGGY